jgi:hypothetical protein
MPIFLLHLAAAYDQSGQEPKARAVLKRSLGAGISGGILTGADRSLLTNLIEKYGT